MKRVLMLWLVGGRLYKYIFVSRIPDNYVIPESTDEVYFLEGRIIDGADGNMEDLVIELILGNEILTYYKDREFLTIIK